MIYVIRGSVSDKPVSTEKLIKYLQTRHDLEGTLYLGYPIIGTIEGAYHLDALLVSKNNGIIVFDIIEGLSLPERYDFQDDVFNKLTAKFYQYKGLIKKRQLMVDIDIITYAPAFRGSIESLDFNIAVTDEDLVTFFKEHIWSENEYYEQLVSAIQAVTKIKTTPKRLNVTSKNSRGAKLKRLEDSIANLDRHQSAAVIETVEGPQRIRGLAGSGKTIVLALKVAYLHAKHPEWLIGVTFNTRALKNQFIDLITRFTFEHKNDSPDWSKVRIIHAWGSPNSTGIYYELCKSHNIEYYDFRAARSLNSTYGKEFDQICLKALEEIDVFHEIYDAILIDEAQDFSESFLKLCYNILKKPKRLVWAYDELQKLNEESMRSPEEIFGYEKGKPRVQLKNEPDKPREDIILEKCYRNPRPILVSAHCLGFGLYRKKGLVQMFDNPTLWREIGYEVEEGELSGGSRVLLTRSNESSPAFLEEHSPIDDLFQCKYFEDNDSQLIWIADEIEKNLNQDELQYNDIIVIHSDPLKTKTATGPLRQLLFKKGINSHLAGVDTSPDGFFEENSITFTSIYRAKGNEAAMVYVMDAHHCYSGTELIKKRNTLFTAITRSKGWVRLSGYGETMKLLTIEFTKIKQNKFKLDFIYPTDETMKKLNVIHRDKTKDEQKTIKNTEKNLGDFLKAVKDGKMFIEDISPEVLESLKDLFEK